MKRARGVATVEFAIVGAVLMTILFAAVEFGRLLWTYAVLNEGSRRAVRLAAVCPVNDPRIRDGALYGGARLAPPGLDADHVVLEYLAADGTPVADAAANAGAIGLVRVRITPFELPLAIPFVPAGFTTREFRATLPRESLGWHETGTPGGC